ncbi:hypothetical protein V493_01580 [Pseudogymnoascus sp. VKM F-4281 (FW-2241)]|nr:hypothetical protein V493_01580 [Pseudogymnoascus sp. VKM F-4281 (FW-2241)]
MSTNWGPQQIPDLTGKVALVTGGNAGIGLNTVKHLALHGAKVYFTARSETKATKATELLLSENPELSAGQLIWLQLNLGNIDSIMKAAEELLRKEQKLDILINNAGMAAKEFDTTDAGWEVTMAVCHVGHFVLTNRLLPLLKNAASDKDADVRVVTVSSAVQSQLLPPHYKFDFADPAFLSGKLPYEPLEYLGKKQIFTADLLRYSMAKLANVLFAQELQSRLNHLGLLIISTSVHPGLVETEGAVGIFTPEMLPVIRKTMVSPDEGSYSSLFAATAREVSRKPEVYKGKYLAPVGQVTEPHVVAKKEEQVRAFWDTTEREVGRYLAKRGYRILNEW